jgi:hypothetical protein
MLLIIAAVAVAATAQDTTTHESHPPCISTSLVSIADNGDLAAADGGKYQFLGEDFIDPGKWRKGDSLRICMNWQDQNDGAFPLVDVLNLKRNETLVSIRKSPRR